MQACSLLEQAQAATTRSVTFSVCFLAEALAFCFKREACIRQSELRKEILDLNDYKYGIPHEDGCSKLRTLF